MKITNYARLLVVILLLTSGSVPVFAHPSDQGSSVEPIRAGDTVTDAVLDVPAAHIDINERAETIMLQDEEIRFLKMQLIEFKNVQFKSILI